MEDTKENKFMVTIEPTDASIRNNLLPARNYQLFINFDTLILKDNNRIVAKWTLEYIRKFGLRNPGVFSIEAGRRCESGDGLFSFICEDAKLIFTKIKLNGKALHDKFIGQNPESDVSAEIKTLSDVGLDAEKEKPKKSPFLTILEKFRKKGKIHNQQSSSFSDKIAIKTCLTSEYTSLKKPSLDLQKEIYSKISSEKETVNISTKGPYVNLQL